MEQTITLTIPRKLYDMIVAVQQHLRTEHKWLDATVDNAIDAACTQYADQFGMPLPGDEQHTDTKGEK